MAPSGIEDSVGNGRQARVVRVRLVVRIAISHAVLAAMLAVALLLLLTSHRRIYSLMDDVRQRELAMLDQEEDLYRAFWGIDLAAHQATRSCELGGQGDEADRLLARSRAELDRVAAPLASPRLRQVADRYAAFAARVLSGDSCQVLRSLGTAHKMRLLHEEATAAWMARSFELHRAIRTTEEEARQTGARALQYGFLLFCATVAIAVALAWWLARGVSRPLALLTRAARRIGGGDFSSSAKVAGGPSEVVELGETFAAMCAQLAQVDTLKAGFVASVSHELRTPLGRLREALALLADSQDPPLSDEQKNVLSIAHRACEKEIDLVNTLLDVSRLRAGGPLRQEAGQSIDEAVREAVGEERDAAAARQVKLVLTLRGAAPPALLDTSLLVRAIGNLVRNAISVAPPKSCVEIERLLYHRADQGQRSAWARITVRDYGPGIPPELHAPLFDAFFARDVPAAGRPAGVGLGLTLAREVARAHRGDLILLSHGPDGARFALDVPLAASPPPLEDLS